MYKNLLYPICFSLSINFLLLFVYPLMLLNVFLGLSLVIICFLYQVFLVFPLVFSTFKKDKFNELDNLMNNKTLKQKFISYNKYSKVFWRI